MKKRFDLKKWRKERGLTQEQASKAIMICRRAIQLYEKNEGGVREERVIFSCDAYDNKKARK